MRSVNITHIDLVDKKYQISLGNGTTHLFTNKRAATDFLAETNKFLTRKMFSVNTIYTRAYVQYRNYWAYPSYQEARNIKQHLDNIVASIDLATDRSTMKCGGMNTFFHLNKALNNLLQVYTRLKAISKTKTDTTEIFREEDEMILIMNIRNSLADYKVLEADKHEVVVDYYEDNIPLSALRLA